MSAYFFVVTFIRVVLLLLLLIVRYNFFLSNNRYKVHYVGYSTKLDEWKTGDELFPIDECNEESKPFTYVFV